MSTIERISAAKPVRRALNPRAFFALLLAAAALCGCARRYDMTLTNGGRVTNVRKPIRSKEGGYLHLYHRQRADSMSSPPTASSPSFRMGTRIRCSAQSRHKAFHIFAQQVGLQIHLVAGLALAQRGHGQGVGNYPDAKTRARNAATVRLIPSTATEPLTMI